MQGLDSYCNINVRVVKYFGVAKSYLNTKKECYLMFKLFKHLFTRIYWVSFKHEKIKYFGIYLIVNLDK
jgi:hypothetical protein